VIIVGNISVGGTGKSPVVMSLVQEFKRRGYRPAIVSRGYGGHASNYPLEVTNETSVSDSGDEAWMMASRLGCPVVVDPNRARAVDLILASYPCDLIISDDGLQHYALQRDYEIALIEGQRFLGNRLLMPFGPLREPRWRLKSVQAVVINHRFDSYTELSSGLRQEGLPVFDCHFSAQQFRSIRDQAQHLSIQDFVSTFKQQPLNAIAGIGNPEAFFDYLTSLGLTIKAHRFADHHEYTEQDLQQLEGPVVMTEKDASKCYDMSLENAWYLAIESHLTPNLVKSCIQTLGLENHKS
jgi:tetraacyldisaccharide 4'-kinase